MAIRIKTFRIKDDASEQEVNHYLENRTIRQWSASFEDGGWNVLIASDDQAERRDRDRPKNDRAQGRNDNHRNNDRMAAPRKEKPIKPEPVIDVPQQDMPLYEAIRKWRNQRAREENVKPFTLFNNKEIETLVKTKPTTSADMRSVLGTMTDSQFERYQNELLGFITGATALTAADGVAA